MVQPQGGQRAAVENYRLNYDSTVNPELQSELENIDSSLRASLGMGPDDTCVGLLNLRTLRLAMIHPDQEIYGASVPKIGILLAWFQLHPGSAEHLDPEIRHKLGLMIKISSNEMASEFSTQLGLRQIQEVLNQYNFYDAAHGGGIWVGKHYGKQGERIGSPVADNSHAVTVRQLLRFYLMLDQGRLVSPAACKVMREIFASPEIPHDPNKFVKGLAGRPLQILRKSGTWEDWFHDTAHITGAGRDYILVALTHHPRGDEYLERIAPAVDDFLAPR